MTTAHRISDDGRTIVCEAEPAADCRAGHDCWQVEWLNAPGLQETWTEWDSGREDIRPGAPVEIKVHSSDEGCSWAYAEIGA